jgi:hypothetical protein
MGKTKKGRMREVIAVFRLSTGYEVPIEPNDVRPGGMDHLVNALICEVMFPTAKKHGWEKAKEALLKEIFDTVERLTEKEKRALLAGLIWDFVCEKWSRLEKIASKKQ